MIGPRKAAKRRNVEFGNTECLMPTKRLRFGKAKRSPQHGHRAALFGVQRRKGSVIKAVERCCIYKDDAKDEGRVTRLLKKLGVLLMSKRQMKKLSSSGSSYLGAGSYGSCCKVRDPESGDELVIKTFPVLELQSLAKEAAMLARLRMEGVQGLVGVCVKTRQLVSYYAGVTADTYFNAGTKRREKLSVLLQVARTLENINKRGFAHNDLSGRNVCVRAGSSGPEAPVIDLGLAGRVGTTGIYPRVADSAHYPWLALELLGKHHDTTSCHEDTDLPFLKRRQASYFRSFLVCTKGILVMLR